MNVPLAQFADSSSGIGSLGIDGKAFVIQLITFLLAFWVLKRWAFGPIVKLMESRRKTIEDGVALGEKMKQDQAALELKVEKLLHEARQKADGIIAGAQDTARQTVRDGEDKARDKAAGILKEAEEQIVQETDRARRGLEKELVGLVADATEAVVGEKIDAKKDTQLIERALKKERQPA